MPNTISIIFCPFTKREGLQHLEGTVTDQFCLINHLVEDQAHKSLDFTFWNFLTHVDFSQNTEIPICY
uniref:Uncharacterized protein n=1 Tax=Arundo donax TaxID=35708 RepID=A0A0A9DRT2_ARUDO